MIKDLQKIPAGWKKIKLGEVIEESKDRNNRRNISVILTVSNIEGLVNQTDFFGRNLSSKDTTNYKVVKKWFFSYNPARINVGSIALNSAYREAIVSPMYVVFKTKNSLLHKYFYYWTQLPIFKITVINNTAGTVRESLNFSRLITFSFPLPPLPEQEKIADILETVDNTIEKTDAIIEKYKRIKHGLMQELLTKGIDENWEVRSVKTHKFKDSPLGRIPSDWEVKNISEVTENVLNGTWGDEPDNSDNCYPVIRSTEINRYGIINLESAVIRKVDKKTVDKFTLRNLDILIVASSGSQDLIGRVALFKTTLDNSKFLFSNFMLRTRTTEILNPVFLYYFLNSDQYKNFLQTFQETTTGLRNFPKRDFLKFLLPLPPLTEQERIASVLSQVDAVIEKETAYRDKLSRIKQGLMEDLLTGKVRVTTLLENNQYQKEAF